MVQRITRILTCAGVGFAVAFCVTACAPPAANPTTTPSTSATAPVHDGPPLPPGLTTSALATLPATTFDAVIAGLLAAPPRADIAASYHVPFDTAVYGADFATPVARIPAKDFLGRPTVVVGVETRGAWTLVLTAARQTLPSAATSEAPAPAQSAAWIPTRDLVLNGPLKRSIRISVSSQKLSILDDRGNVIQTFPVGVGTADTPTPTGTGYLQARYLDPAQGQEEHRIQLTSLHATAADEPYGGADGGLIGIHFQSTARGAVSHGCVRLSADAIAAVDALPLGTAVQITD